VFGYSVYVAIVVETLRLPVVMAFELGWVDAAVIYVWNSFTIAAVVLRVLIGFALIFYTIIFWRRTHGLIFSPRNRQTVLKLTLVGFFGIISYVTISLFDLMMWNIGSLQQQPYFVFTGTICVMLVFTTRCAVILLYLGIRTPSSANPVLLFGLQSPSGDEKKSLKEYGGGGGNASQTISTTSSDRAESIDSRAKDTASEIASSLQPPSRLGVPRVARVHGEVWGEEDWSGFTIDDPGFSKSVAGSTSGLSMLSVSRNGGSVVGSGRVSRSRSEVNPDVVWNITDDPSTAGSSPVTPHSYLSSSIGWSFLSGIATWGSSTTASSSSYTHSEPSLPPSSRLRPP